MKQFFYLLSIVAGVALFSSNAVAQPQKYEVGPLKVESRKAWEKVHRPKIYNFFLTEVYGRQPEKQPKPTYKTIAIDDKALGGKAIREEVAIQFEGMDEPMLVLMYIPHSQKPVPAFVGINFKGNHQVSADPAITISKNAPKKSELGTDPERGAAVSRWPLEMIVEAGYAVVTVYRGDIDPDFDDGFKNGVHQIFNSQNKPKADEWGTISAWAWGLSRVMDYIETDKLFDKKHVAVIGHSRLGKTALWAAATDDRFAMAISNDSGEGGAALSSRRHGELIRDLNKNFPHWFCDNYNKYSDREQDLMIDHHGLVALVAPRPVYVASATLDDWADPEGEFLSAKYASSVWELYGKKGLKSESQPKPEQPDNDGWVGYHLRTGKHDITAYDWAQYIKFADQHFRK